MSALWPDMPPNATFFEMHPPGHRIAVGAEATAQGEVLAVERAG